MRRRGQRLLISVGLIGLVILVGASVSVALSGWPSSGSGTLPSNQTGQPTSKSSSSAAGLRAVRIQIDRLGIDLPIAEGDGIDAPLDRAAHYPGSGWPDGGTNIYVYGHARAGLFLRLQDARVGDLIVLTLADGSRRTYEVATIVPDAPWNAITYVDPTPTEQLTLQTSTSEVATDPRFIVIAFPAQ